MLTTLSFVLIWSQLIINAIAGNDTLMELENTKTSELFLGIDGGGSKCKAVLLDQQWNVLGEGLAGPANPCVNYGLALSSIEASAREAAKAAQIHDLSQLNVGLGLAGVNFTSVFERLSQWQHPFKRVSLTTDWHAACLGAHSGEDGAVIIVGTGSCGYAKIGSETVSVGGHGFPVGDKGSGAWIGLKAVEAALQAKDGLATPTILSTSLLQYFDCTRDELAAKLVGSKSSHYASFAKLVFTAAKSGDIVALAIIQEAADYIESMAQKLLKYEPPRLSMIGGIAPFLASYFSEPVKQKIVEAQSPPEIGAIHFIRSELSL